MKTKKRALGHIDPARLDPGRPITRVQERRQRSNLGFVEQPLHLTSHRPTLVVVEVDDVVVVVALLERQVNALKGERSKGLSSTSMFDG
jgi:hypothetical protein